MTADPIRWAWAVGAVALWLLLAAAVAWRQRAIGRAKAASTKALAETAGGDAVLVAFASQTGFGEELAWMTARALTEAGVAARVELLGDIEPEALKTTRRALFILSTTGEGDAPDSAAWFVRRALGRPGDLAGLSYGLLALGDRTYADFCGFGRAMDGWLRRSGATPLFDTVEVDDGEAGAVRHWQHQLGILTGGVAQADWTPPAYERWRLTERALLNPGSPGGPAFRLVFTPIDHAPTWSAGDIAEVGVPAANGDVPAAAREYSVASLPGEGHAAFLVRVMHRPDGTPGLASGWLTQELAVGDDVPMRIRINRSFHGPAPSTPVILIGNGTGMAGLRAHLKARAEMAATSGAWLMFGERTQAHDAFHDVELKAWLADGTLTRLDRTFSRDQAERRYVQHLIAEQAADISAWIERGAAIYVCGSLEGMASGVHAALEGALGPERVASLTETGRYRRDVY